MSAEETVTKTSSEAPQAVSIFPRDARHQITLESFSGELAGVINNTRFSKQPIEQAIDELFEQLKVENPAKVTSKQLSDEVLAVIATDTIYDSEFCMALRATNAVLPRYFEEKVTITGWFRHLTILVANERFTLTGNACPSCGNNPEAYGVNGGTRCIDIRGCGWWYCA